MKGLMVMNEATDIAFYSVDSQLRAHLHRRMEILENSIGQREEEEDLRGLLTTFFAPLTTSFNVLTSMKKPLFSITADDNFLIVFKKFGEHVFVAVNGDGSESEDFLVRKLHVFNRIIGLLYGPVLGRYI
ncbi:PREDICTED: Hermansky-Pudlak syndrome 1 protein homolog [Amphimedon queenslandica]|uniref:FUZ/MON1/HPS1 first Longin domain-containing protein n=1 Tax=Amphimedon queenslandica TaxID=400682 RepID=A0A1X7SMS7_AMPQE|nr:PREDICTED: Hermansky-Pudlak syndrome 1 protein homolog [Amphimedon queenslandica]|eukprot:XP_011409154.2 PREDICTED: Hermansky-Pudlak syndrome 1 protein homolog [Amphimedon queenslandica]